MVRMVKSVKVQATLTLNREFGEDTYADIEVSLTGQYRHGTPDVHYLPNGDPGYPGDPPEVDDIQATGEDGQEVELTDEEMKMAYEKLIEAGGEA